MTELHRYRDIRAMAPLLLAGALLSTISVPAGAGSPTVLTECGQALKSGFYTIDRNLSVERKKSRRRSAGNCFVVVEDFVTIDLGGFTLSGSGKGSGITDKGRGRDGIVVRNGTITGFAVGIDLNLSPSARISGIVATGNKGSATTIECNDPDVLLHLSGIATGSGGIVTDSTASGNAGIGIKTGSGSRVTGNVANDNAEAGFCVFSASTVSGNTARRNDLDGVRTGSGSTVSGNTARDNLRDGFVANSGSNVAGNTAKDNEATGVTVHCPSLVRGNAAVDNGSNLALVTDAGQCVALDNLTGG